MWPSCKPKYDKLQEKLQEKEEAVKKKANESGVETPRMPRRRMQRRTLIGLMNHKVVFPTHTITYNASGC